MTHCALLPTTGVRCYQNSQFHLENNEIVAFAVKISQSQLSSECAKFNMFSKNSCQIFGGSNFLQKIAILTFITLNLNLANAQRLDLASLRQAAVLQGQGFACEEKDTHFELVTGKILILLVAYFGSGGHRVLYIHPGYRRFV